VTRPAQLAAFENAIDNLLHADPLSLEDRLLLAEVLIDIQNGHDARDLLGIKHKSGPRPKDDIDEGFVSIHYWALQMLEPTMLGKQAAWVVSRHWSIPTLQVAKIGRKLKVSAQKYVREHITPSTLRNMEWTAAFSRGRMQGLTPIPPE
jgi:hypothetical protein